MRSVPSGLAGAEFPLPDQRVFADVRSSPSPLSAVLISA